MALLHPVATNERLLGEAVLPLHLEMYVGSDNAMFLNGPSNEQVRMSEALSACASSSSGPPRMQQSHGPREQWLCTTCGAHFATMFCLREHAKTHESSGSRQEIPRITVIDQDLKRAEFVCRCRVCDKQFTTLNDLEKHMHTHSTNQMLQCTICKKEFILPESLDVHMWSHIRANNNNNNSADSTAYSKPATKIHTCDTCKKTFRNGSYFQLHLRTHTGDKLYSCQMCGKSFSCSWNLKTHLAVHRDEKPFICSICGVGFKLKANMQRHERSHQPYERMAFFSRIRNPNLQDQSKSDETETAAMHLQQSGDKKGHNDNSAQNEIANRNFLIFGSTTSNNPAEAEYGCSLCGKTFSSVELLKFHVNEHIPERPYNCSRCTMGFKVKANLVRHERLHIPPVQSSQSNVAPKESWKECSPNEQARSLLTNNVQNGNDSQMQIDCFQTSHQPVSNLVSENSGKLVELLPNAINNSAINSGENAMKKMNNSGNPLNNGENNMYESGTSCIALSQMNKDMTAATKEMWGEMNAPEASAMNKNDEPSQLQMRCFQTEQQQEGMGNLVSRAENHKIARNGNERNFLLSSPSNVAEPTFDCSLCGKTFPSVEVLKLHLTEHAPDRTPYSCSQCGAGFKVKANLIRHERVHGPQIAHSQPGLSLKEPWKNEHEDESSPNNHHDNENPHMQANCFQSQRHQTAVQLNAHENALKNLNESGSHLHSNETQSFGSSSACLTLNSLNKPHTPTSSANVSISQSKEGWRENSNSDNSAVSKNNESSHGQFPLQEGSVAGVGAKVTSIQQNPEVSNMMVNGGNSVVKLNDSNSHANRSNVHFNISSLCTSDASLLRELVPSHTFSDSMCMYPVNLRHACKICGKTYKQRCHLLSHMLSHSDQRPYVCDFCGKSFSLSWNLKTHLAVHNEEKPFVCSICGNRFKLKTALQRHQRSHIGRHLLTFSPSSSSSTNHQESQSQSEPHSFLSPENTEKISRQVPCQNEPMSHERSFLGIDGPVPAHALPNLLRHGQLESFTFNCDSCGKTNFLPSFNFVANPHALVCDACGTEFKLKNDLSNAPRACISHPCHFCGKNFLETSALKCHVRIHTGERPYPCDRCGKRFVDSGALKRHLRVHTGEKPYLCVVCDKRFTTSTQLQIHTKMHS